jgi:hypothetical protein
MDGEPGPGLLGAGSCGWVAGLCLSGLLVTYGVWLVVIDAPAYRFVVRLFEDKLFLREVRRATPRTYDGYRRGVNRLAL